MMSTFDPAALGEICEFILDGTHGSPERTASGVPVLSAQNVNDGKLDYRTDRFTSEEEHRDFRRRLNISRGDVLLTIVGTIGRTAVVEEVRPLVFQRSVAVLRPKPMELDSRFLFHALGSPVVRTQLERATNKSTQAGVYLSKLKTIQVPLPSLPEQKRIAAILDKTDEIRRKRRQAFELADEFLRSVFLDRFGDPVANSYTWPELRLGECIDEIRAGWSANGQSRRKKPGETGVLKVSAVTSGFFRPDEHKAVLRSDARDLGSLVCPRKGDLLFSRANTRELVAATCIVEADYPDLFLSDKLWRIRPLATRLDAFYLYHLLSVPSFRAELTKQATGTSGSMLNVSQQKLLDKRAPVPPIHLQVRFRQVCEKYQTMRNRLLIHWESSNRLSGSLAQHAFIGQI